jgi:Flp pilus assembly protein TadB
LETSMGRALLLGGVVLAAFGYYALRKIVQSVES